MATVVMIMNTPTFKVATTQAGLTAGQAVECQINSARVEATANYNTIPATGCSGATQSPGADSWALNITWLDDWSVAGSGGLSEFSFMNSGKPVWFELTPNSTDAATKVVGNAFAVSGGIGGTFGDGSAAQSTATWPCITKPTITSPTLLMVEPQAEQQIEGFAQPDEAPVDEPASA